VGLSVFSFTGISYYQLGLTPDIPVLVLVFCATVLGYNFVKYIGFVSILEKDHRKWLNEIFVLSVLFLLTGVFFFFKLRNITQTLLVVLGILTMLYAMPLSWPNPIQLGRIYVLREIKGVKVFIIAVVWSLTTNLIPVLESKVFPDSDFVILLLQRYLWILVLMIPFEIRDLKYDHHSMGTLPQELGINGVKILGYIMLLLIMSLEFFTNNSLSCYFYVELLMALLTGGLIFCTNEKRSDYYSAFFVEGIPILWLGMILLLC